MSVSYTHLDVYKRQGLYYTLFYTEVFIYTLHLLATICNSHGKVCYTEYCSLLMTRFGYYSIINSLLTNRPLTIDQTGAV